MRLALCPVLRPPIKMINGPGRRRGGLGAWRGRRWGFGWPPGVSPPSSSSSSRAASEPRGSRGLGGSPLSGAAKGAWRAAGTESGRGRSQRLFWARPDRLEPRSVQLGCPRPRPGPLIVQFRNEGRRPKLCAAPLRPPQRGNRTDRARRPPPRGSAPPPPLTRPVPAGPREWRRPTGGVNLGALRDEQRPAGPEQVRLAWAQPPPGPMRRRQPRGEGGSALVMLPRLVMKRLQENSQESTKETPQL